MSDRSVRWRGVVAALLLAGMLTACGGEGADEPEGSASVAAPPSVDADGYTVEQRNALDRVEEFLAAVYGRGAQPVAQTAKGLVTEEYASELIATSKAQVEDEGLKWLGGYPFEPSGVRLQGDRASVSGCLDLTTMFLVPRDAKAAGPGDTNVGQVLPATYRLEKSGDEWLVSASDKSEASC